MTFAGLVSTLLTLQLPPDQVDSIIPILADAFGLPEDIRAFLVEKYLPEVGSQCLVYFSYYSCSITSSILYQSQIRLATADVSVGILEKIQLELDTAATLIKLIYAFMWQEYVLTSSDIFLDPEVGN